MRYDVLLCDADNTLFDFNKAEENAFAMACETMGFSSTPELLATYSKINEALKSIYQMMRQLSDKTYGICQHQVLVIG